MNKHKQDTIISNTSNTDWERLADIKDKEIDTSDIPELDDTFFQQAKIRVPPKPPLSDRETSK